MDGWVVVAELFTFAAAFSRGRPVDDGESRRDRSPLNKYKSFYNVQGFPKKVIRYWPAYIKQNEKKSFIAINDKNSTQLLI